MLLLQEKDLDIGEQEGGGARNRKVLQENGGVREGRI